MRYILFLTVALILNSCGGYREVVIQKQEKGAIMFSGNALNSIVVIDDGPSFRIEKNDVVYELSPGSHNVKIYKNSQLIIERTIFLDNGPIMEIVIQ